MTTPSFESLVAKALAASGAAPRTWVAKDAKSPPVSYARLGIAASAELAAYARAADRLPFRKALAGVLESSPMSQWALHPIRPLESLLFKRSPAQVTAFVAGLEPIGEDPDSGAVLVAEWSGQRGTSLVASYLWNDVSPADAAPGDFVVEAKSLRALVSEVPLRRPAPSARTRAMQAAYRRGVWLGALLYSDAISVVDDPEDGTLRASADAAGLRVYARERGALGARPDLAAYWLLSHALLGHEDALADAWARTARVRHPAVRDLRSRLVSAARAPVVMARLVAKHRTDIAPSVLRDILARARAN